MRRRRVECGARWAGLVAVVVIVAAFVTSLWWNVQWLTSPTSEIMLQMGAVGYAWTGSPTDPFMGPPGLHADYGFVGLHLVGLPEVHRSSGVSFVGVPLWMPFLVVGAPTALLWRSRLRERRAAKSGGCSGCGYDRRGLADDDKCPECGTVQTK